MKCNYQPDITPQFEWARKELGVSLDEFKEVMSKIEITNPADRGLPAADLGTMLLCREVKRSRLHRVLIRDGVRFLAFYGVLSVINELIKLFV